MIKSFEKWANDNKISFEGKGIKTVKIFSNQYGGYIDHETKNCIGRISLNNEGHLEIEVIEIESGIKLMYAYYAFQTDFFEDLVASYIRILATSTEKVQSKYHLHTIKKID